MILISDVHDAPDALRRLVALGEEMVILGDLVNLTDYRTGDGAVARVMGREFAALTSEARAAGDYGRMRELWTEHEAEMAEDLRTLIGNELADQYAKVTTALQGGRGLVIHGNVDRPEALRAALPDGFRYVHGDVVEIDEMRWGFVGGGIRTPIRARGEVDDDEMTGFLEAMGSVDVLCTHVPPALAPLRRDVITGREERGSGPVFDYLVETQPRFHFFGDVHQPQATTWRIGRTTCYNASYFRATGRYLRLSEGTVSVGLID